MNQKDRNGSGAGHSGWRRTALGQPLLLIDTPAAGLSVRYLRNFLRGGRTDTNPTNQNAASPSPRVWIDHGCVQIDPFCGPLKRPRPQIPINYREGH
jgi:hypothetical protein